MLSAFLLRGDEYHPPAPRGEGRGMRQNLEFLLNDKFNYIISPGIEYFKEINS